MNILIRADSSSQIGLGHIMRTLVLAAQYPDDTIAYACQDLAGHIMDKIPYPIYLLHSNDPQELITLIRSRNIDMVIFDHYAITAEDEKYIKDQTDVLIMSLDDTYERHHCDILLNHNISADANRYAGLVPSHCELRCGSAFTLIRDEFKNEKEIPREKIYDLFIAMGGADTANLTTHILKTVPESLSICVVTTTANAHLKTLKNYVHTRPNISLYINANTIAQLLHQSRFAIITPSVMVHEVLYMGIPFIAVKTADNQADMFQYLHQHGYNVTQEWTDDSIAQLYHT